MPFRLLATILALSALSIAWPDSPGSPERPLERPRIAAATTRLQGPGDTPDPLLAVALSQEHFYAEVQAEVDAYLAALEAQRLAEEAAARTRATAPPVLRSGACCGPHSDAWWWGVAICEQGGRNDPWFGYFSWMDGSAAGMTWEQQVAKSNALLATVRSESPAWAPACVAAGYRASPSG